MRDTQSVVVCFHASPNISCASADFDVLEVRDDGCWERKGPMVRMVTPESATWALPTEAIHMQIPIDADHSTMVKFSDNYDAHYITVRDRLYECVRKAPGIIAIVWREA
jgi:hypothetical protein